VRFTIEPKGPFSLRESATFGFGQREAADYDGTMRLAFCVDGYTAQAAVALTQDEAGAVHGVISGTRGEPDPAAVERQVARVLSLDHDATGFVALGEVDPVLRPLFAAAHGLRPPLFYSAYEAAFWSVLSARRGRVAADAWRRRLARSAAGPFPVAGQELWALPTPQEILDLGVDGLRAATGIEQQRAERLVGVAEAAGVPSGDGVLDTAALAQLAPADARARLRTIAGIGPFYADLIVIRAIGTADVLPLNEPKLFALLGELYGLEGPATVAQAEEIAAAWVPWRTWAAVLVRAAGPRVLATAGPAGRRPRFTPRL